MQSSGNEKQKKSGKQDAWDYLENRFGVERTDLTSYCLRGESGDFWLVSSDMVTELEVETYGFRALRRTGRGLKPTTYALQFLDEKIDRNIVELTRDEFLKLLRREKMIDRKMAEEGYVALSFEEDIVGCGYYKDEKVSSRIPKGRGRELSKIIEK